jgi:succinate dehydrogenase/fumarate reductase-like Fe-S protein
MNIDQVKEYVTTQLKSYRVKDILDTFDDIEWVRMYEQISSVKPWETERRLIDWARHELEFFRYVLYTERHYEDLLIDKACIECLKCTQECETERKYYSRKLNKGVNND